MARRDKGNGKFITVRGAAENNLKNIDVEFPLGKLICVTGVSGSGKSSLINEILYKAVAGEMYRAKDRPGKHREITGLENIDKIINIDQQPIARHQGQILQHIPGCSTYRDLFAQLLRQSSEATAKAGSASM